MLDYNYRVTYVTWPNYRQQNFSNMVKSRRFVLVVLLYFVVHLVRPPYRPTKKRS